VNEPDPISRSPEPTNDDGTAPAEREIRLETSDLPPAEDIGVENAGDVAGRHTEDAGGATALPGKPSSGASIPFLFILPFLVPLIFFCFLLTPIAARVHAALQYPYEMDGEEGFVYNQAFRLYQGETIYPPLDHEPYLVGNYPPLYPWVVSRLIGPRTNGLPLGRLVVIFSCIAIVQLLTIIAFVQTHRLIFSFLAALLFLITYEVHNWSAFCRVDLPALALTLAGLLFFIVLRARWGASLAAIVFLLAVYTKQTAILAPAACCFSMLFHDRRRMPWFLIPYLGIGAGVFVFMNSVTRGEFFRHLVLYNRNEMDWVQWRKVMQNEIWYFYQWWIAAGIAGAILLFVALKSRPAGGMEAEKGPERSHARGVAGFYALFGALALLLFAKVGSAPNYGLEPLASFSIFSMSVAGRLADYSTGAASRRRGWARAGVLLMGILFVGHSVHVRQRVRDMFSSRNPDAEDRAIGRQIMSVVQQSEGEVLSEFPIFPFLSGKSVLYQPFIMSRLAQEGAWDEKKFTEMIEGGRFSLIITSQDLTKSDQEHIWRFTPSMVQSILAHYELGYEFGLDHPGGLRQRYYVWVLLSRPGKAESKKHLNIV